MLQLITWDWRQALRRKLLRRRTEDVWGGDQTQPNCAEGTDLNSGGRAFKVGMHCKMFVHGFHALFRTDEGH
jgi:hypothetical protein